MWRSVDLASIDVSEERIASIFREEKSRAANLLTLRCERLRTFDGSDLFAERDTWEPLGYAALAWQNASK
jgi:hypothetical protein